jgi:large conductance mechanosensitive channel
VTSLVEGVLMPPIGLALGKIDFSSLFLVLDSTKGVPVSLADAKAKGVPVLAYGALINDVVNFVIVAAAVFLLVKTITRIQRPEPKPVTTKDCLYCLSAIPIKATRCAHCTSEVPVA